jgi:hypothetical protein
MMLGVMLRGFVSVMGGMQAVGMRDVGVMTGLFMLAALMVSGRFAVMVRRALMVLGGCLVVLAALVGICAHGSSSILGSSGCRARPVDGGLRREADLKFLTPV